MADTVQLPADLKKVVKSYLMPSVQEVALRRLKVLNEIQVIQTLVLPGEHISVSDIIEFVGMWQWRPILRRS